MNLLVAMRASSHTARALAAALSLLAVTATSLNAQPRKISGEARDYLRRIIEQMRERSLNHETVDWKAFEAKVMQAADTAQTIADTYPAIRVALNTLGDPLGRFRMASGGMIGSGHAPCRADSTRPVKVESPVGYIKIDGYRGQRSGIEPLRFAGNIQGALKAGDQAGITSWIIDVRGLGSGAYAPALTGLGALLGDGVELFLVDTRGNAQQQEYENGTLKAGSTTFPGAVTAYEMKHKQPKVAVLVDGKTAGTGEMIAVALKGRRDARLFGTPTCGQSPSTPFTFKMEDGGELFLSSTLIADKSKKHYLGPLQPDEVVEDPDVLVQKAVAWLTKGN